jgi:hypothetical protein
MRVTYVSRHIASSLVQTWTVGYGSISQNPHPLMRGGFYARMNYMGANNGA